MTKQSYISSSVALSTEDALIHIIARGIPVKDKPAAVAINVIDGIRVNVDGVSGNINDLEIIEFGRPGENVTQMTVLDNIIFAGTNLGNIYKSEDAGKTWDLVCSGLIDDCTMLASLEVSSTLYASSMSKGITSDDFGRTWQDMPQVFGDIADMQLFDEDEN